MCAGEGGTFSSRMAPPDVMAALLLCQTGLLSPDPTATRTLIRGPTLRIPALPILPERQARWHALVQCLRVMNHTEIVTATAMPSLLA